MGTDRQRTPREPSLRVRTADLDTAREQLTRTFVEHEMSVGDRSTLDCRLDLTPSGRLTLARVGYGTDVTLFAPPTCTCYHVNLPLSGANTVQQNGTSRASVAGRSGIAMLPSSPLSLSWSPDSVQYAIKLPKELLDAHAAKLAGRPLDGDIRFALGFDLETARGHALMATAGFLHAELTRPGGLATMPTARRELESALMTELLMTIPHQFSACLRGRSAHPQRSKILEVMDYIDEHPDEELSTAELAGIARISVRALQAGFRDLTGMSPRAYVRDVRLDRVHLELGSGASGSISDVATRWGFYHLGRFAQQYRERFGVLPSETARGAAS